jgi:hypothetical protein
MPMCGKCGFALDNHCLCLLPDQILCPRRKNEIRCMKHVPEFYENDGGRSEPPYYGGSNNA